MFLKKLKNLLGINFSSTSKRFSNEWVLLHRFIGLILAGKKLTDYTGLFSSHDFKKNDDIILSYFNDE